MALYSPAKGDVMTVTVSGASVTTTATQAYALVVNGDFYKGAWYTITSPQPCVESDFGV